MIQIVLTLSIFFKGTKKIDVRVIVFIFVILFLFILYATLPITVQVNRTLLLDQ